MNFIQLFSRNVLIISFTMEDQMSYPEEIMDSICTKLKEEHGKLRELLRNKDINGINQWLMSICGILEDLYEHRYSSDNTNEQSNAISAENQFILLSTVTILDCWGLMPYWNSELQSTLDDYQAISNIELSNEEIASGIQILKTNNISSFQLRILSNIQHISECRFLERLMSCHAFTNMIAFLLSTQLDPQLKGNVHVEESDDIS